MSERRSARPRKPISFSGFDDQSDDDFADATPPPTKKPKAVSEDKQKSKKTTSSGPKPEPILNMESSLRSNKQRKPVADKIFDRQLEEALQLSILETGSSQNDQQNDQPTLPPPLLSPVPTEQVNVSIEPSHQPPPLLSPQATKDNEKSKSAIKNPIIPFTTVMDDSIEVMKETKDTQSDTVKTTRGRPVKKKAAVIESDDDDDQEGSDFNPDGDEGSDVDDDAVDEEISEDVDDCDSDDSDFAVKSRSKKKEPVKKAGKASSTKSKQTPPSKLKNITNVNSRSTLQNSPGNSLVKPMSVKTPTSSNISSSMGAKTPRTSKTLASVPESNTPVPRASTGNTPVPRASTGKSSSTSLTTSSKSPIVALSQQWKPPALINSPGATSIHTVKSPSSGLRLGLSRNQKLKPLHSSAKVT